MFFAFLILLQTKGTPNAGGSVKQQPLPTTPKTEIKKKKNRFCIHDDIKNFAWFALQLKSATEIRWLQIWHLNK